MNKNERGEQFYIDEEEAAQTMRFITRKVNDLDVFVHSCVSHFGIDSKKANHFHACMEEALSEMLSAEWEEAYKAYPCILYPEKFPSCIEAE